MDELQLRPSDCKSVRLAGYLRKKSGAFPYSWHSRYVVLSGNFLLVYATETDSRPRKVVCVDEASIAHNDAISRAPSPFAFSLTPRGARSELLLAADTAEDRARWTAAIANADYGKMYSRTRDAVVFLTKCTRAVAPFAADKEGVAVPPQALSAAAEAAGATGAGSGEEMGAELPPGFEAYAALRNRLTGSDVLTLIAAMQAEIQSLRARGSSTRAAASDESQVEILKLNVAKLQDERDQLRRQLKRADELLAVPTADATDLESSKSEVRSLRKELTNALDDNRELRNQADHLNAQIADLKKELSTATASAARAARLMAASSRPGTASTSASDEEVASLRAKVRELETTMERMALTTTPSSASLRERALRNTSYRASQDRDNSSVVGSVMVAPSVIGMSPTSAGRPTATAGASPPPSSVTTGVNSSQVPSSGSGSSRGTFNGNPTAPLSPASSRLSPLSATRPLPTALGVGTPETLWEHEWMPFYTEAQRLEKDGDYVNAEQQYTAVLEVKAERCGAESVAAAAAHRDLGRVLALQRRFERAEEHYSAAVRLCTNLLGIEHPNTACALTDLAAVLREQSKFAEAEIAASKAVESLKAGVGADDVSTATALYNLAGLTKRLNKFKDAEDTYAEALRIFKAKLGMNAGETADTLYQMGCLFRKRSDYIKAANAFTKAAEAYSGAYGPGDKRVAESTKRARMMAGKIAEGRTTNRSVISTVME